MKKIVHEDSIYPRKMFSPEEDRILIESVRINGPKNWKKIALNLKGRNGRQCRDRWHNYLSPEIDFEPWSTKDDKLLVEKVNKYGTHWSLIHSFFPKRSINNIKNRWHSFLKNYVELDSEGFFVLKMDNQVSPRRQYSRRSSQPNHKLLYSFHDQNQPHAGETAENTPTPANENDIHETKEPNLIPLQSNPMCSLDAFWDEHLVGNDMNDAINLFEKNDEMDQLCSMLIF